MSIRAQRPVVVLKQGAGEVVRLVRSLAVVVNERSGSFVLAGSGIAHLTGDHRTNARHARHD